MDMTIWKAITAKTSVIQQERYGHAKREEEEEERKRAVIWAAILHLQPERSIQALYSNYYYYQNTCNSLVGVTIVIGFETTLFCTFHTNLKL